MRHALVVGGTGMLANLTIWLADNGYQVSVIARDANKMNDLIKKTSKSAITPVFADYRDDKELRLKLKEVIQKNGKIELVAAWIHSSGKNALGIIEEEVSNVSAKWDLFHIIGSSTELEDLKESVCVHRSCCYHQVKLGFIIENNRSRWLTNHEISSGVMEAIEKNEYHHIVGVIEPWDMRP